LQHKRHGKRAALWIPSIPLRFIPEIQSNIFHQQFSSPVQLNLQSTNREFTALYIHYILHSLF